ncbi:uncharacterized protein LOC132197778 isoform X2 [Neocloeon triangulifer]|uniref:uncharacterized protein LOC132197778 isoform X2 n=1 Tax=Neocloeon triangulifer TaxID=2078957 RepID=UPI00286F27CE|nr:uncharacterized protein LOC132197778 isoform X2 [Neocloeon triangulifer]
MTAMGQLFVLLAAILANLGHHGAAVRVGDASGASFERPLFFSPLEPKLRLFNAYASPESAPAPVTEHPEPENPITPRLPNQLGVQLENVINSQRFRYPDPTTTPRPGTFRARVFVPPGLPSAFSRAAPEPQNNAVPYFTAPDGTLIPGISEIDQIVATNRLQQEQSRRAQQDSYQAQVLQRVQQEALDVIRESVSLITTNPGARRRPNTVIRPQQLSPPPSAPGAPVVVPGQTQAIFQQQPAQSVDYLQQQPLLAQPQQALFPAVPTPPAPPAIPAIPSRPEIPAIPEFPSYPTYPSPPALPTSPAQQPHTVVHSPSNAPITGVSYSSTYHFVGF